MGQKEQKVNLHLINEKPWGEVVLWLEHPTVDREMVRFHRFKTLTISFALLCLCHLEETVKVIGHFYLVLMPGPTQKKSVVDRVCMCTDWPLGTVTETIQRHTIRRLRRPPHKPKTYAEMLQELQKPATVIWSPREQCMSTVFMFYRLHSNTRLILTWPNNAWLAVYFKKGVYMFLNLSLSHGCVFVIEDTAN